MLDHSTPEYTLAFLKIALGHSQNHLAVAGGYVVDTIGQRLRTHPLPRGGSDCVQVRV